MHNFCVTIFRYSHYIYCLQEESIHFGLQALTNFDQEVSKHFLLKTSYKKNQQNSQIFFDYTKFSYRHTKKKP